MIFSRTLAVIALVTISACTGTTVRTQVQYVNIPVYAPCAVDTPATPDFQFHTLVADDDIFKKVKVLLSDRQKHLGYELMLEQSLKACK